MSGFYFGESRSLDCGKEFKSMFFFFIFNQAETISHFAWKGPKAS